MERLRPHAVEIGLALLVAVGVAIWLPLAHLLPWGADATKWVAWSSLENPRWWHWATSTKHFVGYRPVTALAFVANQAVTGYSALGYSLFDLALHATSGVLLFALYRRLTSDRSAFGLVPVAILFGHPATEEVVPYLARRSYLLALVFGLAAALTSLRALRPDRRGWLASVAAAVLLGLAVLSNEVAYVLLPVVVMLALDERGWRGLLRVAPAVLVCAAAVWRRHQVLGVWGGGYQKRFFAYVRDDVPMWRELASWDPLLIARSCWRYLLDPNGVGGAPPLFPGPLAEPAAVVLGAWLLAFGVVLPVLRWRSPRARVPLVLGAWLVGACLVVVLSQTWFWRQAYTLLPPLGMLVAIGLRQSWEAFRDGRRSGLAGVAGGAAILAASLFTGPFVRGPNLRVHAIRYDGTRVAHALRDQMAELEGPGTVFAAVPLRSSAAHIVRLWGERYGASRRIDVRLLAHLKPAAQPGAASLERLTVDDRPALRLVRALQWAQVHPFSQLAQDEPLPVDRLYSAARRNSWLVAIDADEAWTVRAEPPPPGTDLLPDTPVEPEPVDEP